MSNFIIFFSFFYILLLSVVGYGMFFQNLCFGGIKNMNDPKVIYTGFYGLFAITFISIISSLFVPHNFIHNILLHLIGVLFFILQNSVYILCKIHNTRKVKNLSTIYF